MKKFFFFFSFLLLVGCNNVDKETENFINDYLTLRFETVNMINEVDSDIDDIIEHTELVKPYLSEERYEEYARNRESRYALNSNDYTLQKGATMKIEEINLEEVKENEYNYELTLLIDNITEKLRTKVSGLLKIDENGLIYYDWIDKKIGVTEKIE